MVEKLIAKIARVLDGHKIPYMVIGGQAFLLYGAVRLTEDIDITLGIDVDKSEQIKSLLGKMGLTIPENLDDDFIKKTNVLVAIDNLTGIRADFIFSFTPYERQALKRIKKVRLNNYQIKFSSCEDLIIHKIFAGRARDLEDVNILIENNIRNLDLKYIKKWLKQFSVVAGYDLVEKFKYCIKESKK